MRVRSMWILSGLVTSLVLAAALAGTPAAKLAEAESPAQLESSLSAQAAVNDAITYQGRLTDAAGRPVGGTRTMRFILYDAAAAGNALWDSGPLNVPVTDGLFTVVLDVDQVDFIGDAVWLSIVVAGETLSPRQPLYPAPYALGLKPGASVAGEPSSATSSVLSAALRGVWPSANALLGLAPATGTAVRAQAAGGAGLQASSSSTYGVWGSSVNGMGGYFTSANGYGIRVETGGTDHWDHGASIAAQSGYAVYGTSSGNMAIRGESGDQTDLWQPVGQVGVVGIGASRGVYGSSGSSYGIYGTSLNWYGIYGRTSRVDNNFGLYTPDNLFVGGTSTVVGAIMQVMQNGGPEPLAPGDVVVFSGIDRASPLTASPMVLVSRTGTASSTAVAGVVFSRFNPAALAMDHDRPEGPDRADLGALEIAPAGDAAPGEYVLVVVQGPAQVRASSVAGGISPGDLLSTSTQPGYAGRTQEITLQDVRTAMPGTTFGKALEPLTAGQELVYVYVTLN